MKKCQSLKYSTILKKPITALQMRLRCFHLSLLEIFQVQGVSVLSQKTNHIYR